MVADDALQLRHCSCFVAIPKSLDGFSLDSHIGVLPRDTHQRGDGFRSLDLAQRFNGLDHHFVIDARCNQALDCRQCERWRLIRERFSSFASVLPNRASWWPDR